MSEQILYKQFVVVPKRPRMSKGKIASQVAHATYLALKKEAKFNKALLELWEKNGLCVIVLQVQDTHYLKNLAQYLDTWNITYALYIDEGLTEVPPFTPTALATGIIEPEQYWMFSRLELFK